jgi:hypothetical protein
VRRQRPGDNGAARDVPDRHRLLADRNEQSSVGAERDASVAGVAAIRERATLAPVIDVPELDRVPQSLRRKD